MIADGVPTLDRVAEHCLELLVARQVLEPASERPDWAAFAQLSSSVHEHFEVPSTTLTAMMRHLLFALSDHAGPSHIVGAGTYVGYALAWIVRDAGTTPRSRRPGRILAIDIDEAANALADRNLSLLGHGEALEIITGDAIEVLRRSRSGIDCLFIDIDDPRGRKDGYADVLEAALPNLAPGALILAHDPCVELFADAFERFHGVVRRQARLRGPWILPVDSCGLSVAGVAR